MMMKKFCIRWSVLIFVLFIVIFGWQEIGVNGEILSRKQRKAKEAEKAVKKLDEGTINRIHTMRYSGMTDSMIADKIAYEVGGKATAKKVVAVVETKPVEIDSIESLGASQSKRKKESVQEPVNKRFESKSTKKFHEKTQQTLNKIKQNQKRTDLMASFNRDL